MKYVAAIVLLLLVAGETFAQQGRTQFGVEVGYGTRTHAASGILARGIYTVGFSAVDMEVGAMMTTIADDGFGFDIKTRIPIESKKKTTGVVASFGLNSIVWENTVSLGVPIGIHYRLITASNVVVEPSVNITPSYTLTSADKNFVLVDFRIGIRL